MLLDTLNWGSRRCLLTWKVKDISPRFSILELWPKMLPIEECGSGLWPTPRAREGNAGKPGTKGSIHNAEKRYLDGVVQEMWPTPTTKG